MPTSIELEACPSLRGELIAFMNEVCAEMTLAQAAKWYGEALGSEPPLRS